jgi:hypothetical protein
MAPTGGSTDEAGAVALEFALVAVSFFLILFCMLVLGLLFGVNHTLTHAASEGARAALTAPSGEVESAGEEAARTRLGWFADSTDVTATITECDSDPGLECVVVVATYDHANRPLVPPLPGLGLILPDAMSREAVLQLTQVAG